MNTPKTTEPTAPAVASSALFGTFRAELWEADEYIITCKAGPIGGTIDKRTAQWLPQWLNNAMHEAMTKLPNDRTLRQPPSEAAASKTTLGES